MVVNLASGEYQFRNDNDPSIPEKLFKIAQDFTEDNNDNRIITLLAQIFTFEGSENNTLLNSWINHVNFWYFYILKEERKLNQSSHMEILNKALKDTN